jgi:hypothetical protein
MNKVSPKTNKRPAIFGHTDIKDAAAYVRKLRKQDKQKSDKEFLKEIRRWEKVNS